MAIDAGSWANARLSVWAADDVPPLFAGRRFEIREGARVVGGSGRARHHVTHAQREATERPTGSSPGTLRSSAVRTWLAFVALVGAGACSDSSGCLATTPLPAGGLPAAQTVEGGAQIRITRQGFLKLTSVVPDLVNEQLVDGLCVPQGNQAGIDYCYETQDQCAPGCKVALSLNQTQFVATNAYTLTLRLDLAASATVPTTAPGFAPCYLFANGDHLYGDADIELVPDATTGQLTVTVARIRNVDLSRLQVTGSSGFCSGASAFAGFLKTYFAQTIADYLTPTVNDLIQEYLPNPLGIEGVIDLGALLAGVSPGTEGKLEARVVPGGFATVNGNSQLQITGATLGVITGFNADADPLTRGTGSESEPALCVPPIVPPVLGAAPFGLSQTTRGTFVLPAAPGFSGTPDPLGRDLSIGISETMLDVAGHHAVTSGALCMGIGTSLVSQLNVGTFGVLVPSVSELGNDEGNDPVLLVTRPQKAIDFTIGDNTAGSPALTVHLRDLEIDVYPFLFERYVRAFTMRATLDVGINVEVEQPPGMGWQIKPTLVGLSSSDVTITVLNNQFVAESKTQLENALPSVVDLLTSSLDIPAIELPTFAGFAIGSPSIARVSAPSGANFLAINANLDVVAPAAGIKAAGKATLASVDTPPIESVRSALAGDPTGALPRVTFDVDSTDQLGRPLEWSWRIGTGLWRPYSQGSQLVISDRAFAWQGRYTIGLMSRNVGEPASASSETAVPVVIDSVGPHVTKRSGWDGDRYVVRGWDVVSGAALRIAFGRPGDLEPRTSWTSGASAELTRAEIADLVDGDELLAFLEDEHGNRTLAVVAPFHGQAGSSGCSCETGSSGSPDGFAICLLVVVLGLRRRLHWIGGGEAGASIGVSRRPKRSRDRDRRGSSDRRPR